MLQRLYGWSTEGGHVRFSGAFRRTGHESIDEYLRNSPETVRRLRQALANVRQGRGTLTFDGIEEVRAAFNLGEEE